MAVTCPEGNIAPIKIPPETRGVEILRLAFIISMHTDWSWKGLPGRIRDVPEEPVLFRIFVILPSVLFESP
ncbi:MAG: hypothetical protein CMN76_03185 [Spirochaetaceae bacterium]|nr:hypothetical protein [Spirochaetaceae bacterium]|tara:strand:- start:481 stop:693 length:213 start_codon:yes stop_codon:yes gene_type:complete